MADLKPDAILMYQRCGRCAGSGEIESPSGPIECPACNGAGYQEVFQIDMDNILTKCDDILNKCNDILDKCNDILEEVT